MVFVVEKCEGATSPWGGVLLLKLCILVPFLGQLTSHPWPSFGKGENKGRVLLWYSCFDRSILMFLMREGLQCRNWNIVWWGCGTIAVSSSFPPLPKLGQLSGCGVSWPREFSVAKEAVFVVETGDIPPPVRSPCQIPLCVSTVCDWDVSSWRQKSHVMCVSRTCLQRWTLVLSTSQRSTVCQSTRRRTLYNLTTLWVDYGHRLPQSTSISNFSICKRISVIKL